MDVLAVYAAARDAVTRARAGSGPSFLVFETYRYYGHGMSDRNRPYRSHEEEKEWRKNRDPIDHLAAFLTASGQFTEGELAAIAEEIKTQMALGVEFAERSPYPDPGEVFQNVYAD
jgi:pyruvate dehydrogenase E1 component alpha subunit